MQTPRSASTRLSPVEWQGQQRGCGEDTLVLFEGSCDEKHPPCIVFTPNPARGLERARECSDAPKSSDRHPSFAMTSVRVPAFLFLSASRNGRSVPIPSSFEIDARALTIPLRDDHRGTDTPNSARSVFCKDFELVVGFTASCSFARARIQSVLTSGKRHSQVWTWNDETMKRPSPRFRTHMLDKRPASLQYTVYRTVALLNSL